MPGDWDDAYTTDDTDVGLNSGYLRSGISAQSAVCHYAQSNHTPLVSYCWIVLETRDSRRYAIVKSVWTFPGHRRLGIASCLQKLGERWALGRRSQFLLSEADGHNKVSLCFNRKYGLTQIESEFDHFTFRKSLSIDQTDDPGGS
jgi:hypothetical protein